MRNWGTVITAFYTVIVILLATYGIALLVGREIGEITDYASILGYLEINWIGVCIMVCAQALLLFLSVDTSWRRMKSRRHVLVTAGLVGLMTTILVFSVLFAIAAAHSGDDVNLPSWFDSMREILQISAGFGTIILVWVFWGGLFYVFSRHVSNVVDLAVSWLLKGSALELLVAIPCHIIVRQRNDCCAPIMSAYGIATGIAIMLLAFGPGVLYLYQHKLGRYKNITAGRE